MVISHEQFAEQVNSEGGSSRSMHGSQPAQGPGVMVSIPGAEKVTPAPLKPEEAKRFKQDHSAMATGQDYHGAWTHEGEVYQDVSRKHTDLDSARKAGERDNQIAGYDLGKTDKARPEGGEIFFDRRMPGTDANPKFQSSSESTSEYERMSPKPSREDRKKYKDINRGATYKGKPITINEVMGTIAKNRRERRAGA